MHVQSAHGPTVTDGRFAIAQQELPAVYVPEESDVERAVANGQQGVRLVRKHDTRPVGARKCAVGVWRALIPVVEAAHPDVVVRSRQTNVGVYERRNSGLSQPADDVFIVAQQVVIPEHRVFTQWRLNGAEAIADSIHVTRVKRDEVTAKQQQLGVRVGDRRKRIRKQLRV